MYILFINSSGKCDIFFSAQFNNNSNNKKNFQPMGSTRPMWVGLAWLGLAWTYVMGWVGLIFFDPSWWIGSKNLLNRTQLNLYTPLYLIIFYLYISF